MAHYDLIIIGSGPAGRAAAIQAGKLKRKVLVVDRKDRLGGVSVHTGTIPSKTLRETVLNLSGYRERSFYGRSYRVKDNIDAGDLKARLHMTLDHEVDVLEHQFNRNHVDTLAGHGEVCWAKRDRSCHRSGRHQPHHRRQVFDRHGNEDLSA
jgi:NAD(P) transhydrogenase